MQRITSAIIKITAAILLVVGLNTNAEDKKGANPTGTWTWSMPGRDGQTREATVKLKKEGNKLTGSMPGRQGSETQIENAKIDGDTISFTVTREANGNKMVSKYSGKITGDTITGKIEFERNGEARSRDWTAKRKEEKKG